MKLQDYINEAEVVATKRQNMIHLEKMKPAQFIDFAHDILDNNKGILQDVNVTLKVDGAGIRFGKDSRGNFFFETSRSGPIQTAKAFSNYAMSNPRADKVRAKHYDDIYDYIKASSLWKDLPKDTKVVAEIMYNPMAEVIKDKIKFVSVEYDRSKLGRIMTIFPFHVESSSQGRHHPDSEAIIKSLYKKSNKDLMIASVALSNASFNVETFIKPAKMLGNPEEVKAVLASRKKVDREKKMLYIEVLDRIKVKLAQYILNNPDIKGKDKFGKEIEGLVLAFDNKQFKVTTAAFKNSKAK